MNYNRRSKNSSTTGVHLMCATVFVLFSFCWLFFFQQDVLAMAQHVLSGGLTHYNRLVGAILITAVLYILQIGVYNIIRLNRIAHALTYGPSFLLLGILSDVTEKSGGFVMHETSWWLIIFVLIVWLLAVFLARMIQEVGNDDKAGFISRSMWINMAVMAVLTLLVPWIGNSNAVFHYRMKVEQCLKDGDVDGALMAGRESLESDEHLLMLRMYALARKGELGERLFEYPITGNSSQMLPTDSLSCMMLYPVDSMYKFIGARPATRMAPVRYLELVQRRDTLPNKTVNDYLLCGMLIDRDLDGFVTNLGKYYHINDSLPKHYREALTLYTHMRSRPVVVYHNNVMDEDYDNLVELEKQYPLKSERMGKVEEHYRGTYWYFYRYE